MDGARRGIRRPGVGGWFRVADLGAGRRALLDLDVAVRDWVDAHRPEPLWLAAKALYFLGSANLVASILLVAAAPLAARDRTVRPVLLVLVTAAASYVVGVFLGLALRLALRRLPLEEAARVTIHSSA